MELLHKEVVKKAGEATKAKYGREHYVAMGKKGRQNILANDPDYYKKLSKAGVLARKQKKEDK